MGDGRVRAVAGAAGSMAMDHDIVVMDHVAINNVAMDRRWAMASAVGPGGGSHLGWRCEGQNLA